MTLDVHGPAAARRAAGLPGVDFDIAMSDVRQARTHLAFLRLRNPGMLTELRILTDGRMRQHFFEDVDTAARFAVDAADRSDVYVGVVPRSRRAGGRDALAPGSYVLWAECDTQRATVNALDFGCPLMIRSSPGRVHCYWPLAVGQDLRLVERANKRLAAHLGADPRATDAARILRVAGTRNHKRGDAHRVSIVHYDAMYRNALAADLVGDLPDPEPPKQIPVSRRVRPSDGSLDALRSIPARVYIPALCGREVVRDMVTCPFHGDGRERTPSLHVGGPNAECWHCFGCDEGGDVFDFAARLWGLDTKTDFKGIKRRLEEARL